MRTLLLLLAAALAAAAFGRIESTPPATATQAQEEEKPAGLEERWGIRIESLRLTAGGYMLDFRYRVLDPAKAKPLAQRNVKPQLIDQASGAKLQVPVPPKVGALRNAGEPEAGKVYWMFFGNPGMFLKAGARVTVIIGEFRAENLLVE